MTVDKLETPPPTDYIGFAFALLVALGGLVGFMRKGSLPSLVMGVGSGLVLATAAHQTSLDPSQAWLGVSTSFFLALLMGYRFFLSGAFMPAGLVAGISMAMTARYAFRAWA